MATVPFLAAAYVTTLIRIMHSPRAKWVRTVLTQVGRIALTNYPEQSLAGIILFSGVGFGLAGRVSPPLLIALAVTVFAAQALLSAGWLRRHRDGRASTFSPASQTGVDRVAPLHPADRGDASTLT